MKIALTASEFHRHGGEARYVCELAERLAKKGHNIHIYTQKYTTSPSIIFHKIPNVPDHYPRLLSYLPYFIHNSLTFKSHDYDIVHTAGNESLYQDVITTQSIHKAGLAYKKKYNSTGLGILDKTLLTVEKHIYTKHLFKHIICDSESCKADLQTFYKVPDDLITVIPLGVNPDEFYPIHTPKPPIITLLIVATEFLRKGVPELIKATNILSEKYHVRLIVVGSPAPEGNNKDQTYYYSFSKDNIIFTGKVQNLNEWYNKADIFVFPTKYEAWGVPVCEAMSCGLPVITTNIGAGSLITPYKDGMWFKDPYSPQQIASDIETLIKDEALRTSLGKEARKTAMKYTWERMTEETLKVYFHLIE